MNGNNFKSSAYIKAIDQFKLMNDDTELNPDNLKKIKGIGKEYYRENYEYCLNRYLSTI